MKFSVTNLCDVAPSLTEAGFSLVSESCPTVMVDIRNPAASVTNLKAAISVKLKLKDAQNTRLVAVIEEQLPQQHQKAEETTNGKEEAAASISTTNTTTTNATAATEHETADTLTRRYYKILDDLDADKKAVLTSIFSPLDAASTLQLYVVRSADLGASSAALDVITAAGVAVSCQRNSSASSSSVTKPSSSSTLGDGTTTAGGVKRGRDEGEGERATRSGDDAGREALSASSPFSQQKKSPPKEGSDEEGSDDSDDDDSDSDGRHVEEGDEWVDDSDEEGSDGVFEIDWAQAGDDLADLVPELAPAERDLITELVALPNASEIVQQVMDGRTAEAMAAVQTASPRLFALITEHSALFTELMTEVKDMIDEGYITSGPGVIEHLQNMVTLSNEMDMLASDDDAGEGEGEEGEEDGEREGAAPKLDDGTPEGAAAAAAAREERRKARNARLEQDRAHAMNAIAGGASEVRPLTEVDEARIASLIDLGFDREKAVAAYLRMGRNVERAANSLFESM